jgi:voltage-gated potassium channel
MTPQEQIAPEKSMKINISRVLEWRNHNKYTFNLIALILFLILLPLFSENTASQYLVYVLIILVLISAIFTISGNRLYLIIGIFFALLSIILNILYYLTGEAPFYESSIIIPLFFFGFVTIILFSAIIRKQKITFDIICGAISVYFLIGITWAYGIMVLELLAPGSFDIAGVVPTELRYLPDFISFSFSVLTTTGNFNVTALTSFSRMIMMFEMITGTLFIAILISWLVGKVLTRERAS